MIEILDNPIQKAMILIESLSQAHARLKEAENFPDDLPHRESTIKRFEFSFELSWKLMKAIAQINDKNVYSPKNAIRAAAQFNLIDKPKTWMDFANARNLTTHTYQEDIALSIYKMVSGFTPLVEQLLTNARKQVKDWSSQL